MINEYTIQIKLNENHLDGDEFWPECLEEDPTGIAPLMRVIKDLLIESNLIINYEEDIDEIVQLIKFEQT
jgi:hypothetical protein